MTTLTKILVVDDDPELRQLLKTYLTKNGYDVLLLPDPRELEKTLSRFSPQLIVLDWMMPHEDGISACRRLRAKSEQTPIIMLTARDETVDRIIGLQMGADDYLCKPFDPRELLARIEAVLRRPAFIAQHGTEAKISFGEFVIDPNLRVLLRAGQAVELSGGEFDLLLALARHPNRILSRDRLLTLVHGDNAEQMERAIDVQIHRLRKLLEVDAVQPQIIKTVWGRGYVFSLSADGVSA